MNGGYNQKLLYIDLTSEKKYVKPLDMGIAQKFLGGKGLAAKILYDEMKPRIDPLGPENMIVLATGPLTGVPISGTTKIIMATKSPLTNTWNDSSASGFFAPQLKFAGYDAVIIKGKADEPVYIWIKNEDVEIRPAKHLWGKNPHETDRKLKEELNDKRISVATIGLAGEKLVRYANVTVDLWRHAGRGGIGAVMGSKNLKAVVVRGDKRRFEIKDMDTVRKIREKLHQMLKTQINRWGVKHNIPQEGTLEFLDGEIKLGVTPWRNYQTITPVEMQEEIRKYYIRTESCPGCIHTCWIVRGVKEGKYAGIEGVGPEYESLSCLGPVCAISDIPTIIYGNYLCNLYGMDAISTGASIAFAMECYENGILTKDDVNGLDLRFGNCEAFIELIKMIGERRGIGKLLGEGTMRASQEIGKGSEKYAIHTKGLEYPGYLPKNFPAMALALATADRGACHLRAWIAEEVHLASLEPAVFEEKELRRRARLVVETQNSNAWLHSLGICTHVWYFFGYNMLPELLEAVTGWKFNEEALNKIGERVYNLTRLFNVREGFTRKDDILPWRFMYEPIPDEPFKGACIKPEYFNIMLDEYYDARGWNKEDGIPTKAKLKELDLI